MKQSGILAAMFLLALAGCAAIRGDPAFPPLPFARAQDIPYAGAVVSPSTCPDGSVGLLIVPVGSAYTIFLFETRAIIVDNSPGEDTPVWFVRVIEDREFLLDFVLTYREAKARYPRPCNYFNLEVAEGGELA